jgi:hypothetical protein
MFPAFFRILKMGDKRDGVAKRLAEMNSTIYSNVQKMTYQTAWSIGHFGLLTGTFAAEESLKSKPVTIRHK